MSSKLMVVTVILVLLDFVSACGIAGWITKRQWYKKVSFRPSGERREQSALGSRNIFRRWIARNLKLYQQAGYSENEARKIVYAYGLVTVVLPILAAFRNPARAFPVWLIVELIRRGRLKQYKRAFEAQFNMNLYKVYRFLCTQLLAGHSAVEILRHVHLAAPDKDMRNALNAFTGAYFRTLDFERASNELTQRYPSKASETLLTILRQGIESGEAVELIQRQEEVMIQRYLESVAVEQDRIQFNLILLIAASGSITFAVIAIPLALQMLQALESLFV
ncbi:hypothetical protein [Acidaminobacter hydrogenoformans]|uniref:Type II secretion system (T2SS), protein F n=1 Tax=Acidaminobacter hydrogenoformans DSM 2784 TaxID=1120920 RepID=A0A1G5RRN3_9FIRM|nr:hypothetical protein [Acidaminobacter hydrogenoformans]SCZ76646.1 hypothetical protein SAMN03080599_00349 [Acidaminobacter hydrogenoformans DSM 2784]